MEFTQVESMVVQATVDSSEAEIRDLSDLQLALVGGGIGDTVHV